MSHFSDEPHLSAAEKAQILADWRHFIRGGFRFEAFTQKTYEFLIQRCGFLAHFNRDQFWEHFFANADLDLLRLLAQFGGEEKHGAEVGGKYWLVSPSADLSQAMCQEVELIYETLLETLNQFAVEHYELQRQADLKRLLAEVKNLHPDYSEAELLAQLNALYDAARPLEEFEVRFELTPPLRERLAQAVASRAGQVDHPSVFDLRAWLDQAGRLAPESSSQVVAAQQTLFTTASETVRPPIAKSQPAEPDEVEAEEAGDAAETSASQTPVSERDNRLDLEAIKARLSRPPETEPDLAARRRRLQAEPEEEAILAEAETMRLAQEVDDG